jgi:tartrate-resistant acid phosphatase type 5
MILSRVNSRVLVVICLFTCLDACFAQETENAPKTDVANQLVQRLPNDWRPVAIRYRLFSGSEASFLKASDDDIRFAALFRLARMAGAEEFVAAHLDQELASNRLNKYRIDLLDAVAYSENWTNSPLAVPLLEREAASDPDPQISMSAVEGLHALEARRLQAIVERRLKTTSDYENHKDEIDQLEKEEQDLAYIVDGIALPRFLLTAPSVFQVPTKDKSIRVAMMGDFGTRGEDQRKVAAAMVAYHRKKPFDFGITLGDNFYFQLQSPDDPGFKIAFEDLYGLMNITFFPAFGNHDWFGDTPGIEMLYSNKNSHWHLPAPYYTYTAGPVQFFVINTGNTGHPTRLELRWLKSELDNSHARWKVVYGHYPIFSSSGAWEEMYARLMPVLKDRADVYLAGHYHDLQQHKAQEGVNFFIIGASGRGEEGPVNSSDPETLFLKYGHGFGVLEADDHTLTVRILGEDGKELHDATFHK